jgi:hypothetical protein
MNSVPGAAVLIGTISAATCRLLEQPGIELGKRLAVGGLQEGLRSGSVWRERSGDSAGWSLRSD